MRPDLLFKEIPAVEGSSLQKNWVIMPFSSVCDRAQFRVVVTLSSKDLRRVRRRLSSVPGIGTASKTCPSVHVNNYYGLQLLCCWQSGQMSVDSSVCVAGRTDRKSGIYVCIQIVRGEASRALCRLCTNPHVRNLHRGSARPLYAPARRAREPLAGQGRGGSLVCVFFHRPRVAHGHLVPDRKATPK